LPWTLDLGPFGKLRAGSWTCVVRLLIFHVSRFAFTATHKGRSSIVEPLGEKTTVFEEGLLLLASAEAGDERAAAVVGEKAAEEVVKLAGQVGAKRALVHPFAHLFAEPAPLAEAVEVLDALTRELRARGLEASRSPFGWFFSWELSAKGHPLSRLARRFMAEAPDR
jgi:threonyl-tRNA synthetase